MDGDERKRTARFLDTLPLHVLRTLLDRGFTVYLVLDARHTNAERVEALARAGLNERVRAVAIGPPRAVPVKSPYQN